jgi:hypothetical protein
MRSQPRVIATLIGGSNGVGRVVENTKRRYQAVLTRSGKLLDLEKGGVEYRRIGSCFRRFRVNSVIKPADWAAGLQHIVSGHHTTKVFGKDVLFQSSGDQVTVDSKTDLVRRDVSRADPRAGVPYESTSLSYPTSVAELRTPSVCP